jgi:hypothetical protein
MADKIFDRLIEDHDKHRQLLKQIAETHGDSEDRRALLEILTKELKAHAAAEEMALYSTTLRKPPTNDETRHSVAEHHEIEEMLNDLAATDMSSSAWLAKFDKLAHRYTHHIDEEEEEHFPDFGNYLTEADKAHMRKIFDEHKAEECEEAEVTPVAMADAKE